MLGPADGTVDTREVLDALLDAHEPVAELDPPLDPQVRERQQRPLDEGLARLLDLVPPDRRLAVHGEAGGRLGIRRPAEDVEAQVVPHDAREERRVDAAAVLGMPRRGRRRKARSTATEASRAG